MFTVLRTSVVGVETRALNNPELQRLLDRSQPPAQHGVETAGAPAEELHDVFAVLGKTVPKNRPTAPKQIGLEWRRSESELTDGSMKCCAVVAPLSPQKTRGKTRPKKANRCLECKRMGVELHSCGNLTCSVSFCTDCLPLQNLSTLSLGGRWSCPQHRCMTCLRKAEQAGGALFRCMSCPRSWCESCLPGGLVAHRIGTITGATKSGPDTPSSAVLIQCQWCCKGASGDVHKTSLAREPTAALDLTPFASVGNVDKTFAFLDAPTLAAR